MKIMIITSSPNEKGLTESCGEAAKEGVNAGNGETLMVRLNDKHILNCNACNHGWGTCLQENQCQLDDDFNNIHNAMSTVEGYIIITPVYWGDMSESAKAFFDRLRRCEASLDPDNINNIQNKPFICVAAAGGSGNGTLSCLTTMERLFLHLNKMNIKNITNFDYIGITQRNKSYMLDAILESAKRMILGD
jgi:multimeric flavodoxin WrbA